MADSAHDHDHSHHPHDHAGHAHGAVFGAASTGRAFALGLALNLAFVVLETASGLVAHSMALVADAAHNVGDVLGLALAWGAAALAQRRSSDRRTYGLRRSTILAALANATLLFVAVAVVAWEALTRLRSPRPVVGATVIAVAAAGVLVNGLSALMFVRAKERDANVRAVFVHLASDAVVSLGVVIAGVVMLGTRWWWLDPAVSLAVSVVIVVGAWRLLRESLDLALDATPHHIDLAAVRAYLAGLPGVVAIHDLHVWATSTSDVALTAHLVMPWSACPPGFHRELADTVKRRFAIGHTTVQIDPADAPEPCVLVPGGGREC